MQQAWGRLLGSTLKIPLRYFSTIAALPSSVHNAASQWRHRFIPMFRMHVATTHVKVIALPHF